MCAMQRIQQRHFSAVNGLNDLIRRISNRKIVPVCMEQSIVSNILDDLKVTVLANGTNVDSIEIMVVVEWLIGLIISTKN